MSYKRIVELRNCIETLEYILELFKEEEKRQGDENLTASQMIPDYLKLKMWDLERKNAGKKI